MGAGGKRAFLAQVKGPETRWSREGHGQVPAVPAMPSQVPLAATWRRTVSRMEAERPGGGWAATRCRGPRRSRGARRGGEPPSEAALPWLGLRGPFCGEQEGASGNPVGPERSPQCAPVSGGLGLGAAGVEDHQVGIAGPCAFLQLLGEPDGRPARLSSEAVTTGRAGLTQRWWGRLPG